MRLPGMIAATAILAFCHTILAGEPVDPAAQKSGVRQTIRRFVSSVAPEATARQACDFGVRLPAKIDPSKQLVILIHGLDCDIDDCKPLADFLTRQGQQVAFFGYPDDQPVADSAALLGKHMIALSETFPTLRTNIVAYSLGGIVARAYVEGNTYVDGSIDRMILLAPPNHGSSWAKFAILLEAEEQWQLFRSRQGWSPTWAITDGLGEAASDISPDSKFLTELNSHPRRAGVKYTIITGNRHPARRHAADWIAAPATWLPKKLECSFTQSCEKYLTETAESIRTTITTGDGPVSIESAKLDGVDDVVILPADHVTIYFSCTDQPPAAWDTIRDRLSH